MSSSLSTILPTRPIYTRETLLTIEAELEFDSDTIVLTNGTGHSLSTRNLNRGGRNGARGLSHGASRLGHIVAFQGERELQRLEERGEAELFFPVYSTIKLFRGPSLFVDKAREAFQKTLEEFEASPEATAIANLVKSELRGRNISKIIAFGLGCIGLARPFLPHSSLYEHAAVNVLAKAIREVSCSSSVTFAVQEPCYTDVCIEVLEEFGFVVIEGYGAKGFTLIDDNTVVVTHHPDFPFRQIIADMGSPVLICMASQVSANRDVRQGRLDLRTDIDSVRSHRMLQEYHAVDLKVPRQMAFWDNTWFVRNEMMPLSGSSS